MVAKSADELAVSPLAVKYFNDAMNDYKKHQYATAILHFRLVVEMFPDYAKAHYYLGNCYSNQQRVQDAIKEYRITYKLTDGKGPLGVYAHMALLDYGKSNEVIGQKQMLKSSLSYSSGEGISNHYDPYLVPDKVTKLQAMRAIGQQAGSLMRINNQDMQYAALGAEQTARWGNQGILAQGAMAQIAAYGGSAAYMGGGGMGGYGGYMGGMGGYGGYMGGYGGYGGYGGGGGMSATAGQMGLFGQMQMMQNYDNAASQMRSQRHAYEARNQAIKQDVNGLRSQFKRGPLYDGVQLSPSGTNLYTQYFGTSSTPRKRTSDSGDEEEDY